MENAKPILEVSFRLTRLQRIINPIDRLVYAFFFMLGFVGAVTFAVREMTRNGVWTTLADSSFWACFLGMLTLWCVMTFAVIGRHLVSLYLRFIRQVRTLFRGGRIFLA